MSDILEDQRIHYIVKDYRRMFNAYWFLIDGVKRLQAEILKRDKKILSLEAKVESLSKGSHVPGETKTKLLEIQCRSTSIIKRLQDSIDGINKNLKNVEEVRELINI